MTKYAVSLTIIIEADTEQNAKDEFRQIADKLDELNGGKSDEVVK